MDRTPRPPPPPRRTSRSRSPRRTSRREEWSPPVRSRPQARGWPEGVPQPQSFQPDQDHWDTNYKWRMPLPKRIVDTPWTKKACLSGHSIYSVPLHALLHDGVENYAFRLLANGRYANFEVLKSYKESCIIQTLLEEFRKRDPHNPALPVIDLEGMANQIATEKKMKFATPKEKKAVYTELGQQLAAKIMEMNPVSKDSDIIKELERLKKENAKLKNSTQEKKPKSKKLPVQQEEDQDEVPEEEEEDQEDPWINFRRGHKQKSILSDKAPAAASKAAVDKFITKENLGLTAPKYKAMLAHIETKKNEFEDMQMIEQGELSHIAVQWGLPVKIAAKMADSDLIRVIAAAQYIS